MNRERRQRGGRRGGRGGGPRRTQRRDADSEDEAAESNSYDAELVPAESVPSKESVKHLSFPSEDASDTELNTRELVKQQNCKKKKSGGFQSMGLSYPVFKGVMGKGYKVPTPIQRKCVPVILEGRDVVAMARTGSGKTAAFLVPMFERLHARSAQAGARALVLSPTRELALQTSKFTKELGKHTGLKTALILGGDRMEDQFAALHENPDIIIGTPGRLMHVVVEMNLKLQAMEYVVFDEADRLFEMGFAEQLTEIIRRLPDSRQTLLFSATLPKQLVEFARAGLSDPVLIRLDVDSKLSDQLKLAFMCSRADDKPCVLLHLLRTVVKPHEQTVVFVATKHHVEYLRELVSQAGMSCAYIYSALDQTERKINVGKFVHKKTMLLIVTDVAARGIDIPMLDNVINYNFPGKPKLFVHRVGRVARAGRPGTAYSLVAPDEIPFVIDLHLFLGRPLRFPASAAAAAAAAAKEAGGAAAADTDGLLGRVPQCVLDDEDTLLRAQHESSLELSSLLHVAENAFQHYARTRPAPSSESIKRARALKMASMPVHPLYAEVLEQNEHERLKIVDEIKNYKSKATIFEINATKKTVASEIMRAKRAKHGRAIGNHRQALQEKAAATAAHEAGPEPPRRVAAANEEETEETLDEVFSEVVGRKRKRPQSDGDPDKGKRKKVDTAKDEEFYIPYQSKDANSERGLSMNGNTVFEQQASGAVLDLMGDDTRDLDKNKQLMRWDRKRKRFVRDSGNKDGKKKIKTESGQYISASYKTNFYAEWRKKNRIDDRVSESEDEEGGSGGGRRGRGGAWRGVRGKRRDGRGGPPGRGGHPGASRRGGGGADKHQRVRSELRNPDQILKARRKKERMEFLQSGGVKKMKASRRGQGGGFGGHGGGRGGGPTNFSHS
ncbi:ATP-dependent RNA helicase DDX54-like [Lampetra planeri]